MANVTYLLGAGASCHALPIGNQIKERIPKDIWDTHNPVEWYVHTKVKINKDGSIVDTRGKYSHFALISKDGKTCAYGRYASYYVHPDTNLLCRLEPSSSVSRTGTPKITKKSRN